MANQRLIYGFHAVNARLWQNPKSITELYVQEGKTMPARATCWIKRQTKTCAYTLSSPSPSLPVAKAASAYMPPQPPKRARLKAKSPARWQPLSPWTQAQPTLTPCAHWKRLMRSVDFVSKGRLKTTPAFRRPFCWRALLFAAEPFRLMSLFNRLEKQPWKITDCCADCRRTRPFLPPYPMPRPLLKAASASHSGDAARQTDSPTKFSHESNPYRRQQIQLRRYRPPFETAVKEKGMTVFAVIDHQAAARQSGLDMQPAKVIVFGTPKAGTPLMQKTPPSPCNCRCASSLPKLTAQSKSYSTIRARWCRAAK